jgi:thioredoxin 1
MTSEGRTVSTLVTTLTSDGFDAALTGPLPWLVDFWAPWCAPCLALEPVLTEIAGELDGRLRVGRLDTLAHPAVAARYRVTSVPTLLVFTGGEPVHRLFVTRKRPLLTALEAVLRPS